MNITQVVKKFPAFMEPRDSLLFPQNPTVETYREPVDFSKQLHVLFLQFLKIILRPTPKSTKWCRILRFSDQSVFISYLTARADMYTRKLVVNLIYFRQDWEVAWCDFRAVQQMFEAPPFKLLHQGCRLSDCVRSWHQVMGVFGVNFAARAPYHWGNKICNKMQISIYTDKCS
jgi:hypothetical protein